MFQTTLGMRDDVVSALGGVRLPFKFALTIAFAAAAAVLALRLLRPGASLRPGLILLGGAVALLVLGVAAGLIITPEATWASRMLGRNSMLCMVHVPIISAIPLGVIIAMLRRGAPSSRPLTGAVAGLLAGTVGATFYAAQCPDDSPLFVAVRYTHAIAVMACAGAAIRSKALRW